MPKFVLLWTDVAIWLLALALLAYGMYVRRDANLSATWRKVFADAAALAPERLHRRGGVAYRER